MGGYKMKKYETPEINITKISNEEVIMASTLAGNNGGSQSNFSTLTVDF